MKPQHHSKGLPRFRPGHHPNPLRRAFEDVRAQGYLMIGEVCEELGIGKTTLRRYEDQGIVPKIGRVDAFQNKSVRVFTNDDVKQLREALQRRG